jgi:poly(A) polymerase
VNPRYSPQPDAALPEPQIVGRGGHGISRANIDPDALKILYRLHHHGFLAYLVGGSVRDLLLGKRPKDFDVSTDAHPNQVQRLFRNSRVIGRRFRLVQVFFQRGKIVEISTFRRLTDSDDDGMLQANNTFGTPAEDALRRDITINALFYNIADFSVVDYVGGLADLRAGLIRAVGDADLRFHRDPVRVMRAVRHTARAGFSLTPETMAAVQRHREELALCPSSRIRDELLRDLKGGAAAQWLELAHRTGLLYSLLPTLKPHYAAEQSLTRARARALLAQVDQTLAQGGNPDDTLVLAALLWPALEELAQGLELEPGRTRWAVFVRENLPALAAPVAFARRVMERLCQAGGLMDLAFVPDGRRGRLPKKIAQKGYLADALALARLLGHDLLGAESAHQTNPAPKHRPRRRRTNAQPAEARRKN